MIVQKQTQSNPETKKLSKDKPFCILCGRYLEEVVDPITLTMTGKYFRCLKCEPNLAIKIE